MGMHTGLRGVILLKDNELTKAILQHNFYWRDVAEASGDGVVKDYAAIERWGEIPNNVPCYMPAEWNKDFENVSVSDNRVEFSCSLKNYEGQIKHFVSKVLPHIADDWRLEELYEGSSYSTLHSPLGEQKEFNLWNEYDVYKEQYLEPKEFTNVFDLI